MVAILGLFVIWIVCSMVFVMMGIPTEAAMILGGIAGIGVVVLLCKNAGDSPPSNQRTGYSRTTRETTDEDIEDMMAMDYLSDGKLDGKFDFFKNNKK